MREEHEPRDGASSAPSPRGHDAAPDLVRLNAQLEEERRILELLNETGAKLASNLERQTLLQAITDAATELSGAQFGAFFHTEHRPDGGLLSLYTLSGAPREAFDRFGHPRGTPLFGPTFRGESVIRIADVLIDPRYGKVPPHYGMPDGHLPVRSYMALPVVGRSGEVMGGMFFGHPDPGVFTERAERLIQGIASQAAIALDNARLYEQARKAADERERLLAAERAVRKNLERASTLKDEFLATLSHELRTPLNAILGWAQVLTRQRSLEPSMLTRGLDAISRNARAQAQLVEDLIDMNQIVSGTIRLELGPLELAPLVEAAVESMMPSAATKGITVQRQIDAHAAIVLGDAHRLQQVIWNLLSNALKFTDRGGAIEVSVQCVGTHAEIRIRDNGIGMDPEFLPFVFDRFRQADSSATRRYRGLGLGLAIVRQLVELHGGSVRGDSEGPGRGATFTVMLPLHRAAAPSERPPATTSVPRASLAIPSLTGVRVLVVDDEADARELVEAILTEAEAKVTAVSSADEALDALASAPFDVLVSDIGMPVQDGYDLVRAVRALPKSAGGRIPAIALTAFARSEDRARVMLAGYQVHVAKPIEAHELIACVKSLVSSEP